MTTDRVLYNDADNYLGPALFVGSVDEIVFGQALVHIESLGDTAAHLFIRAGSREITGLIRAVPTTRAQQRAILAHSDDRLYDHLRALWPWPRRRTIWSIPPWRRPVSAVRSWREAARAARAALLIDIDHDADEHEHTIGRPT